MKLFTTILFALLTNLIIGQSFEGTLVYKTNYHFSISDKMAQMGLNEEKMVDQLKKSGAWTDSIKTQYKQGDYITYTNFKPQSWSVYVQKTNKLYSFQKGDASDICTVTDVSKDLEFQMFGSYPVVKKLDTIVDVNGRRCEVVRVKWKMGTYDYYYDSTFLKVDHTLYENHKLDGWADFLKISHALPIKIVKTVKGLSEVTLTLIKHTEETIDPKLFIIPELIPDESLNIIKVGNRELYKIKK